MTPHHTVLRPLGDCAHERVSPRLPNAGVEPRSNGLFVETRAIVFEREPRIRYRTALEQIQACATLRLHASWMGVVFAPANGGLVTRSPVA